MITVGETKSSIVLPDIIGLPPELELSDVNLYNKIKDSMPIATICPGIRAFDGMSTLKLNINEGQAEYKSILANHGFTLGQDKLTVAFLADSFPTDSFSNTYQESAISDMITGVSKTVSGTAQMLGVRSAMEAGDVLSNIAGKIAGATENGFDDKIAGLIKGASTGLSNVESMVNSGKFTGTGLDRVIGATSGMLSGARADFPQIWADSSFNPSYTMTIRLYNPYPSDQESTEKYIIGPIAALMILATPRSKDGFTYNYPFLNELTCKGIYYLNPCYVSNISIIKGGDQQQIAYNQRMGIVDVRLDFGSLYSSLLVDESGNTNITDRPTLSNYLDGMRTEKKLLFETDDSEGDDGSDDIPDDGSDIEPDDTRDPDPELSFQLYQELIVFFGSLEQTVTSGYAVPKSIAIQLYENSNISLEDLKSIYSDAP